MGRQDKTAARFFPFLGREFMVVGVRKVLIRWLLKREGSLSCYNHNDTLICFLVE